MSNKNKKHKRKLRNDRKSKKKIKLLQKRNKMLKKHGGQSTPPRISYHELILALLEEEGATPESVYKEFEVINDVEFEKLMDACEDLYLDTDQQDPIYPKIKQLNDLIINE